MNIDKASPHLTAKIVQSYVRHHRLGPDQLTDLIGSIHGAIAQLGQPPEPEEVRTPAIPVRRSVHRDYVVCLDCGYRAKTLRRPVSTRHGLSKDQYLVRWGLKSDHPLTAPRRSGRSALSSAASLATTCSKCRRRVHRENQVRFAGDSPREGTKFELPVRGRRPVPVAGSRTANPLSLLDGKIPGKTSFRAARRRFAGRQVIGIRELARQIP